MRSHEQEFDELVNRLDRDTDNWDNFDSTLGMDEEEMLGFDSTMNMDDDDDDQMLSMVGDEKFKGLSQFDFRCEYVTGGGGLPVNIQLFQTNNNVGVVAGQTLTFTNGVDTAIVRGDTASFIFFQNELITKPFMAKFFRMNVVAAAQFSNIWTFNKSTAWGGNKDNTLNPNSQLTPEQFQLLRVDLSVNYKVTSSRGISFNLGPTEIAASGGTRITVWSDVLVDESNKISGKSSVMKMAPGSIGSQSPSLPTAQLVGKLAKLQAQQVKMMPRLMSRIMRQASRGR